MSNFTDADAEDLIFGWAGFYGDEDQIEPVRTWLHRYEQPHTAVEYYEEMGPVLWWHLPVCEPPAVARFVDEIDGRFDGGYPDGWHTHFSQIPIVWGSDGQAKHPIAGEKDNG